MNDQKISSKYNRLFFWFAILIVLILANIIMVLLNRNRQLENSLNQPEPVKSVMADSLKNSFKKNIFDSDGDGIPDDQDLCPNVPGQKKDNDLDGIIDSDDHCYCEKGSKRSMGCPDDDDDGVPNKTDECPKLKGTKKTKGCPDTDGDGIPDKQDPNPLQPSK